MKRSKRYTNFSFLRLVAFRFLPVVFVSFVTTGCATPTRSSHLEVDRDLPIAKFRALLADQFLPGARVRFVADAAGATFATVDDVHVVEIPVAVAEPCIKSGFCEAEEAFVMASQTHPVDPFLIGYVEICGIASPEHPEVVRAMRVMACLAFALLDRAMEKFFPGKLFFDVPQGGIAKIVLIVATQTCCHFGKRQEPFVLGIVGRVAGTAAPLLQDWFVRHLHSCQLLANIDMALDAEIRHFFLEQLGNRPAVGIVAGGARAIFNGLMNDHSFLQGFGEILMAFQAQIPDGSLEEVLFRSLMGVMAFGTGANSDRTVHELLLERSSIMAPDAETCPVLTDIQQKPARAAVRLVAGETVTILYRRVNHFLLTKRIVALFAENRNLSFQFPALCSQ